MMLWKKYQSHVCKKDVSVEVCEPQDTSGQFFDWLVTKGDIEKYVKIVEPGKSGGIGMGSITMPERLPRYIERYTIHFPSLACRFLYICVLHFTSMDM